MIRAFVCGWPIGHSKSPLIHGHWLGQYAIKGSYEKIAVEPERFSEFLSALKERGYAGGNITIPHKETALKLVDRLEEAAQRIGAVNTVWFDNGQLVGGNTDWIGFLANLDQFAPGWSGEGKKAIIIGAGGASRAILYALIQRRFKTIFLANRTIERAGQLAAEFASEETATEIIALSLNDMLARYPEADLLVNTSSMGMENAPGFPPELLARIADLKSDALVTDIVYSPLVTPLLAAANACRLKTVDGLGMLLHQAVPGFEKWFGIRPQVTEELREKILQPGGSEKQKTADPGENSVKPTGHMTILGLTGSIGMGKSTTAQMFRDAGIPVHDADASVHELYAGKAAPLIEAAFPGTTRNGVVDRNLLSASVIGNPEAMKKLEAIIHPLVAEARDSFLNAARENGSTLVILDIPLLFETGGEKHCDQVLVVTASPQEQKRRVLAREGMTEEKLNQILSRQLPDSEKRRRADFIIDTSNGMDAARQQVTEILEKLKTRRSGNA